MGPSMTSTPCLEVAFSRRYGTFDLCVDLIFGARITAVVGPSGSGKTTLLRCIAGLDRPDAGGVSYRPAIGDAVAWHAHGRNRPLAVQARGVGFVFQDFALFPHLSVAANVAFGARDPAAVAAQLSRLELTDLATRLPRGLSGGQQQRVAIARALATSPRVLLLDEPFAALDAPLRGRLYDEFTRLLAPLAMPVVLVTHDLSEASRLASQLVVLDAGRVIQVGDPLSVLSYPATEMVAQLAGLNNIFDGHIDEDGCLAWGPWRLTMPARSRSAAAPLRWCIRGDGVQVAIPGASNAENQVIGVAGTPRPTPTGWRLPIQVAEMGMLEAWLTMSDIERLGPIADQPVVAVLQPSAIHILGTFSQNQMS